MGQWNSDGSLCVPLGAVTEAVRSIDSQTLGEAVDQFAASPERFPEILETASAALLIEKIGETYRKNFRKLVAHFQQASSPAEADKLWTQIDEALFAK